MVEGTVNVLVVEDNRGDVRLIGELLEETGLAVHIDVVGNGEEALTFLKARGTDRPSVPHLIILDLNMPRMGGKQFLHEAGDLLKSICVVIFSGSPGMEEIAMVIPHRRMVKPSNNKEFDAAVVTLREIIERLSCPFA